MKILMINIVMKPIYVVVLLMLALMALIAELSESLIITSVIAGDKKFKTISFDSKFIKPLTFEKEMPLTQFRRHRTLRPPKFDIDINIPIKLPLEDEYPQEEYKKPVESHISFETGEIHEKNNYAKRPNYKSYPPNELAYAGSGHQETKADLPSAEMVQASQSQTVAHLLRPQMEVQQPIKQVPKLSSRADVKAPEQSLTSQASSAYEAKSYPSQSIQPSYYPQQQQQQEFVPGGFVNLQLSGPTGGPQMTYEDYDREKWAQQLSQAHGAMPYPILNYQQLQNFYGGLGTFTNGLPDAGYTPETGIVDKFKTSISHLTSKLHFG